MSASDIVLQAGTVSGSAKLMREYGLVGSRLASAVMAADKR